MSRLALRSAVATAAVAGTSILAPSQAWAQCVVHGAVVTCTDTSTTDTTYPANATNDRHYAGTIAPPITVNVNSGATISGNGIAATNTNGGVTIQNGGTISVDAGNMPSAGGAAALSINTNGGPVIYVGGTNGGNITNSGAGDALDIKQAGGSGDITVTGSGNFVAAAGAGVSITNNGSGSVAYNNSGLVTGTGADGIQLVDTALGGNVSVTTGAVTASGAMSNGIDAALNTKAGNLTVVANGDINAGNLGVDAQLLGVGATGNVSVTTNGAVTSGSAGIQASTSLGTGTVTVTAAGPVAGKFGIFALSGGGSVSVTAGDVTGTGGTGIVAQVGGIAPAGTTATVVTNGTILSQDVGIFANNAKGLVSVTANGAVTSNASYGMFVQSNSAAVNVATTVTGTNGLVLNNGFNGGGDVSVTGTGGFVGTNGNALHITNFGTSTGSDTINISGASSATGASGILITDNANTGNVALTTGAVTATGETSNGIDAQLNTKAGNLAIVANGDIKADGNGVAALLVGATTTGNVSVTTNGAVTAGITGIVASNFGGPGTVTIVAAKPVIGEAGIFAASGGGSVSVTSGDVTGTSNGGIVAQVEGVPMAGATATVVANGAITGQGIAINAGNGGGLVSVTANGTVTGITSYGMFVQSNSAVVNVASTVTGTNGLVLKNGFKGGGDVSVTGTGGFVGTNGNALHITNLNTSIGSDTVNISGASSATGASGILISDNANTGNVALTTGAVTATGATSNGIDAQLNTKAGNLAIVANGDIKAGSTGVEARLLDTAATGNISVTTNRAVDGIVGIDMAATNGTLVVSNIGQVQGDMTGVKLVATGTGTAMVTNSGVISGGTNAIFGSVNNTAFTILNSGALNGAVNVTGSNVAASTWTNASGASASLGSGSSSFSGSLANAGTIGEGAGGTLAVLGSTANAGRINFAGAGTFTTSGTMANSGVINLQNNLTSNIVTVGGNYTGGGQLLIDYSDVTASADRLLIGGTGSGNTNVVVNRVGGSTFVPGGFIPVVTVAGGAPVGAFAANISSTGLFLDSFGRNPANATQFGVIQTVNPQSGSLGSLTYISEAASALLDDPISPFVTARNNPSAGALRFSLWMRTGTGHTTQDISSTFSGGGTTLTMAPSVRIDHQAAQIGGDLGIPNIGGKGLNLNIGVMGGWYDGQAPINASDRIKVETPFVGGYVVLGNGAFSLEGTVRHEWRKYLVAMASLFGSPVTRRLDGSATSYSIRGSYRIGGKTGLAATPFASFTYADSQIDTLQIDALTLWVPGSDTTKIGQAGLRLSYRGGSDAGVTIEPFASAARLENWSRGDSSFFAVGTPATNFALDTTTWNDAMRYSAGLMGNAANGRVSAFVVGNMNDGAGIKSFTLNAGVRFNF